MKFLDEYRDPVIAHRILAEIRLTVTRPWVIMEVCGGQTHSIVKHGIDQLLPPEIELVHGPGCPVCVTPIGIIDQAIAIAARPEVIFCSFGDMLRVPGSSEDLFAVKAKGGDVRIVYSPLEALKIARANPDRRVVFFAVGFETTAPGNAMAIIQAEREGVANFSELASHVLVPPALVALLSAPDNRVQGYLAAGHVCAIMGTREYQPIAERFLVPIVATGFEPVDILAGILMVLRQLEEGRHEVENQYQRAVRPDGNPQAKAALAEVFEITDREWRGIGMIPASGLEIRDRYRAFDAAALFPCTSTSSREPEHCISGAVLKGVRKPHDCPAFGLECSPEHPLGATMVSGEGACSAYYRYHRTEGVRS